MRKEKELKQLVTKVMGSAEVVYLSTIDRDGFPNTRAMLNLRNREQYPALTPLFDHHRDDLLVYLTTNTSSAKMKQIEANPASCVYFCIPGKFRGLMLAGRIEVIIDSDLKKTLWQDGWEMYYPGGLEDPDYTILCLLPAFAKGWYEGRTFELSLR